MYLHFFFFYLKIKAAFDGIIALTQKYVGGGAIARPIHDEDDELTPAWLTTALNERGNLPAGVTVTSLNFLNLGEGRGYAGKYVRWLIDDSSTSVFVNSNTDRVRRPPFSESLASYLCYLMLMCTHSNDSTHSSRYNTSPPVFGFQIESTLMGNAIPAIRISSHGSTERSKPCHPHYADSSAVATRDDVILCRQDVEDLRRKVFWRVRAPRHVCA